MTRPNIRSPILEIFERTLRVSELDPQPFRAFDVSTRDEGSNSVAVMREFLLDLRPRRLQLLLHLERPTRLEPLPPPASY